MHKGLQDTQKTTQAQQTAYTWRADQVYMLQVRIADYRQAQQAVQAIGNNVIIIAIHNYKIRLAQQTRYVHWTRQAKEVIGSHISRLRIHQLPTYSYIYNQLATKHSIICDQVAVQVGIGHYLQTTMLLYVYSYTNTSQPQSRLHEQLYRLAYNKNVHRPLGIPMIGRHTGRSLKIDMHSYSYRRLCSQVLA